MAKSKHTPGPWHRNIKPASKYPTVWAGRNTHVAVLADHRHGADRLSEEEQEANINLIAAAPDLLAAAKAVLAGLNARIDAADPSAAPVFEGIAELHDAIAKAGA